jgi:hypothetical protein
MKGGKPAARAAQAMSGMTARIHHAGGRRGGVASRGAGAPKSIPRLSVLTFDPGTLQSNRFDAFF